MQTSPNTSKWWQNLWAALIFFTRLPLWRIYQPPRHSYQAVVEFWPLTGWFTGFIMAATLYFGSQLLPYSIAVLIAIIARLLLTGALHEDGLADFCDGFGGGGNNRQRILDIMKDSHIGTYGVVGLIFYFMLLFTTLHSLPPLLAAYTILAADPFSKMLASQVLQMMPYARSEEESKAKNIYRKIRFSATVSLAFQGLLPLVAFIFFQGFTNSWQWIILPPCLIMYMLYLLIYRKLQGYTGDCCGAMCLLIELVFYITLSIMYYHV